MLQSDVKPCHLVSLPMSQLPQLLNKVTSKFGRLHIIDTLSHLRVLLLRFTHRSTGNLVGLHIYRSSKVSLNMLMLHYAFKYKYDDGWNVSASCPRYCTTVCTARYKWGQNKWFKID
jgi:hypothetical protein